MKVKTIKANVLKYGQKKGVTLEVSEAVGEHLLKVKAVEKVKEKSPKKKEEPKKDKN